ncbi:MAG: cell division protein FtsH, partial [Thermomicrobiales bacterium]
IDAAHQRARDVVQTNADKLKSIAELLLAEETIEGEQLEALFEQPRPRPRLVGPPAGQEASKSPLVPTPADTPQPRSEWDRPPGMGHLRPQPAG